MIIESQYFPCIAFWAQAYSDRRIEIEAHENYQKRSYRNKCNIYGANGSITLSVPLEKGKNKQMPIKDVRISYVDPWITNHLQSIKSAYGRAAYYEFYWEDIEVIIKKKHHFLYDLNWECLEYFASKLGIELTETLEYNSSYTEGDFRQKIRPRHSFTTSYYPQVFEESMGFQSNMSILDLLFCTGPEMSRILKQPLTKQT